MKVNFSDEPVIHSINSIFLAGPTLRKSSFENSWRKEAVDILKQLGFDGIVYIPEYNIKSFDDSQIQQQALWEREALETASCIVFWVPRDNNVLPGFTTNVEFGTYIQRKPFNIAFGYPESATKMEYMEWLYHYECVNSPIFHTLKETLEYAIKLVKTPPIIGKYYLRDHTIYQIVGYDRFNNQYIACWENKYYREYDNKSDTLYSYNDMVIFLKDKIEKMESDLNFYTNIFKDLTEEENNELKKVVDKLKLIKINIQALDYWGKSTYYLAKAKKGYKRRLKRVYRLVGRENYNRFVDIIENSSYDAYWLKRYISLLKNQLSLLENKKNVKEF